MHGDNAFVTLTYRPEALPAGGTLVPRHMCLFVKKLRKCVAPRRIRFFGVGEYGDVSQRPHYHLAVFGLSIAEYSAVESSWEHGFVHVGDLSLQSSAYIAGYVLKKMTRWDDQRLDGRHPEFARMSNRPGIGRASSAVLAEALRMTNGAAFLRSSGDVPKQVRIDGAVMPLDTYMRNAVRQRLGLPTGVQAGAQIAEMVIDVETARLAVKRAEARAQQFRRVL